MLRPRSIFVSMRGSGNRFCDNDLASSHIRRICVLASKHPGFASVQNKIAKKEGVSKDRAGAILAASSRGASKKAKKANPRLKRVKG